MGGKPESTARAAGEEEGLQKKERGCRLLLFREGSALRPRPWPPGLPRVFLGAPVCALAGTPLPQRSVLWSGFIPPDSDCVCCRCERKRRCKLERRRQPRSPGGGRPGLWLQPPGGQIADPSSLPSPGEGPAGIPVLQTRMIQRGMIIKIPYTSKLTECFYGRSH